MTLVPVSQSFVSSSRHLAASAPFTRTLSQSPLPAQDAFERSTRPPLRRIASAPGPLAPVQVAGLISVQNLRLLRRAAGDLVALVQWERLDRGVPLLAVAQEHDLRDAVLAQLHRTGLTVRLADCLEERLSRANLETLTRFFNGPWGAFYRDTVLPLAEEIERVRRSYHMTSQTAGEPKPDATGSTFDFRSVFDDPTTARRRADLDRMQPLVWQLAPKEGAKPLCDMLAGLLLTHLSGSERRTLRAYLRAFTEAGLGTSLDRLGTWMQGACVHDGIKGWAMGYADALIDLEACNRAIARKPRTSAPRRRRAELYLTRLRQPPRALHDMTRLIGMEPSADNYVGRAKAYIAMERWSEAEADLQEALERAPEAAAPHAWRAVSLLERHDVEGAKHNLRRAQRRDPYDPDVCLAKLKISEHELTQRLRSHPDDVQAYLDRAVCRGGQRNFSGALNDCRTALRLAPDNAQASAGCGLYADILGVESHG